MPIIICPGVHSPQLTEQFVEGIQSVISDRRCLVLPTAQYLPYSPVDIYRWLDRQQFSLAEKRSLFFIAFSAGVVGGIGAALAWQFQPGKVIGFVAIDGWGMPLAGNFPCYRVSHDRFTHWSSAILGAGKSSFYVDPSVTHLDLWRSPQNCWGWQEISVGYKTRSHLNEYLDSILIKTNSKL